MSILDILHQYKLRSFDNISAPVLKTPVVDNNPGTATVEYAASFVTLVGETEISDSSSISTAPDTMSGFNRVRVEVQNVAPAATSIRFWKKDGEDWKLLGTASPASVAAIWDEGQTLTVATIPAANTSGRPNWFALLPNARRRLQRAEVTDLQAMLLTAIQNLADTVHKAGDIISGCSYRALGSKKWACGAGKVYAGEGIFLPIPAGEVTVVGTGTEKVGVSLTPVALTDIDDPVLRDVDQEIALAYANPGCDRLVVEVDWVVDEPGMMVLQEFLDGQPKSRSFPIERTQWDRDDARRRMELSGSYCTRPFPITKAEHPTDSTKLVVTVLSDGKAYPEGFETELGADRPVIVPKARDTQAMTNSSTDAFECIGGFVIGTGTENFDVDGLAIKLKVGSGQSHTVTFTGNGKTAAEVCTAIEVSVNAYPTASSPDLVACAATLTGEIQIVAAPGKNLTLEAVASDAYTELGLSTGVYTPTGQRIYPVNDAFVKALTNVNYGIEAVIQVTHNGATHIDDMGVVNVYDLLGASNAAADCHDGKYDYIEGIDFEKSGNSADFAALGGTDPGTGATYYMKLRYQYTATKASRVLVRAIDVPITKGAEDGADNLTFTGAASVISVKTGEAVTGLTGAITDAVRLVRVNDSVGQSTTEYSLPVLVKNSTALAHSTSQVSWAAAGTQGEKPAGQPNTAATYYVTVEAWQHVVEGDFVGPDSYDMYEEIEIVPLSDWKLRDCIDFRTASGTWPVHGENPVFNYTFYLSRVDRIVLDKSVNVLLIQGDPAKVAPPPKEQTGALTLATLKLSPYTYSVNECQVISNQLLRLTQADLLKMKRQIEYLQYYAAINNLETQAAGREAATNAKGMFVDPIIGQGKLDVAFNKGGISFTAAVDATERCVRLQADQSAKFLEIDEANSEGFRRVGRSIVLDFEEELLIDQPIATMTMNINPENLTNFTAMSVMKLTPEMDIFMDTDQLPELALNVDNNLAALMAQLPPQDANAITWGSWNLASDSAPLPAWAKLNSGEEFWDGGEFGRIPIQDNWFDPNDQFAQLANAIHPGMYETFRERTGTSTTLVPDKQTIDLGNRVIDITAVPMMRTTLEDSSPFYIDMVVQGLSPNGEYAGSIEGVVFNLLPTGTYQAGASSYQGHSTVAADNTGMLTARFQMPAGIPVGQRVVKVFLAADPTVSSASATFYSQGWRNTTQRTTVGFDTVSSSTETFTQQEQLVWVDPLAETIQITGNPDYISSVKVYFKTKSETIPVTCAIRETLNGYPTRNNLQIVTLQPSQVNVSDDSSVATTFTFDSVVGYKPGEYCIVLLTNCDEYNVFVAEVHGTDLLTDQVLMKQAYDGVVFWSPNGSTWDPYIFRDLKMQVYKSNFQNDMQIVFHNLTGLEASQLIVKASEFIQSPRNVSWSYRTSATSAWQPFAVNVDTYLDAVTSEIELMLDVTGIGGTYAIVEKWAGILLLTNKLEGWAIWPNALFTDDLALPSTVTLTMPIDTDGVNGVGVRSVTPYYSVDDGVLWAELEVPVAYTPVAIGNGQYLEYQFQTPGVATISGVSNTTPIVVTSEGHRRTDNMIVEITAVGGCTAANGTWRVQNKTADTFELVDPVTGADSVGNGAWTSGGTMSQAEFDQCRFAVKLTTSNAARTPKVGQLAGYCA